MTGAGCALARASLALQGRECEFPACSCKWCFEAALDVFLINLDRDDQRLAFVDEQLRREHMAYRRFPAVDARKLDASQSAYHAHPLRTALSAPEIGCLLSHIGVWRAVVAEGLPCALVLEDDVHLAPGLGDFLAQMRIDPNACEVQRLETVLATVTAQRKSVFRIGKRRALELRTNHAGSAAYIITQAGAQSLLRASDRFHYPPDTELFDFGRRAVSDLKVIQWTPAPCAQDWYVKGSSHRGLGSHIEAHRLDVKLGINFKPNAMSAFVKRSLRPLYTAAYDASLWPRGRTRLRIPFG